MTGRDIESDEFTMCLNDGMWEFIGDAEELAAQEAEFAYQCYPIVKTIRSLLNESIDKQWKSNAKSILEAGERIFKIPIAAGHVPN